MIKFNILSMIALTIILLTTGCQNQNENELFDVPKHANKNLIDKNKAAFEIVSLLQDKSVRSQIISSLEENKLGINLSVALEMAEGITSINEPVEKLRNVVKQTDFMMSLDQPVAIEVPELWLYKPNNTFNYKDVLITYAPKGEENTWDKIKAYKLDKSIVYLDPQKEPDVPVIVFETNGTAALEVKVDLMNKKLQTVGLQKAQNKKRVSNKRNSEGLETTVLNKISLKDDEESWVKGAAEIYAVTSGIRNDSNEMEPEIKIVGMPYLNYEDKNYYPNQIMLFWDDYDYQAANIQLFEQDTNDSYEELVSAIIQGVFTITGTLSSQPWLTALGEVSNAILQAIPDNWWEDSDDYVDSYYTIMKDNTYVNHYGAANNAKVSMSPLFIPEN